MIFIYLFLAVLGLPCCSGFSLVVANLGLLLAVVHGLLAVAPLTVVRWLQAPELSSRSSRAPERRLSTCGARA